LTAVASPLLAAATVGCGLLLGWRGVDLPAQVYRIASFRAHGLALWDSQWFGGHWTLDYSVLFPAVAAVIGVAAVTIAAAALAALAFDRLVTPRFGSGGRLAAIVFAVGTAVQSAIGQLPFLAGEALGLCACWAATRKRWGTAAALALAASLFSPLAGAFVAVAMAGWAIAVWLGSRGVAGDVARAAMVALAAVVPIAAGAVLFPGQGAMPYPASDYVWEMAVAAGIWLLAGRVYPVLRAGIVVYAAAATLAFAVPSPLGGNVGRLEDVLAVPLAVALLWGRRSWGPLSWGKLSWGQLSWGQVALPVVAVPLVLSQWAPAWGAMTSAAGQPSTHAAYFAPLVAALKRAAAGGPAGRVEVVPTEYHWEAVYVAAAMPLARGWERQLDEGDNPIFYGGARLDAASYRAWLDNNGVRFVALPDAPLDFAGVAEGRLVAGGVPGLRLVWHSAHWRMYALDGSSGIVAAPDRLISDDGTHVVVRTVAAGPVLIRIHYGPGWRVTSGAGCVAPAAGGGGTWIRLQAPTAEQVTLQLSLLSGGSPCPAGEVAGGALAGSERASSGLRAGGAPLNPFGLPARII
jgi:hypothetical protein